jgi:predicted transcriptional regulator
VLLSLLLGESTKQQDLLISVTYEGRCWGKPSLYAQALNYIRMGEHIQKFDFMNLTLRGYIVLLVAEKKGCVCTQDVRRLYALSKRSKRAVKFLRNMVKNGLLYKKEEDVYTLTPKAEAALELVQAKIKSIKKQTPVVDRRVKAEKVNVQIEH